MSRYVNQGAEVDGSASEDEDDDTVAQHLNNEGGNSPEHGDQSDEDEGHAADGHADGMEDDNMEDDGVPAREPVRGRRQPASNQDRQAQNMAAIEGVTSEVEKFMNSKARSQMHWANDIDRYRQDDIPEGWEPWGRVPDSSDGYLKLREKWLSLMACTSKLLQTVDNKHLNRHMDYMYSGPMMAYAWRSAI